MVIQAFVISLLCISFNIFSSSSIKQEEIFFQALTFKVKSMEKDWNKCLEKIYDSENKCLVNSDQLDLFYGNLPFNVDIQELYDDLFLIEEDLSVFISDAQQSKIKKSIQKDLLFLQTKIHRFEINLKFLSNFTSKSREKLQS